MKEQNKQERVIKVEPEHYVANIKAEMIRHLNTVVDEPDVRGYLMLVDTGKSFLRTGAGNYYALASISRNLDLCIPPDVGFFPRFVLAMRLIWTRR